MPTKLLKPITRELIAPDQRGRTMIVEILPGDELSFRLKGKRTRYTVSLHACHLLAIMEYIKDDHKARMERHKTGRGRKPKPLNLSHFARHLHLCLGK